MLNYISNLITWIQDIWYLYIHLIPSVVLLRTWLIAKQGLKSRHYIRHNLKFETWSQIPQDLRYSLSLRHKAKKISKIRHKIFDTKDKRDVEYETQQKMR